jgi:hypothetical protein
MINLGAALTISASCYFPTGTEPGSIPQLVGLNEVQHQVYRRIRRYFVAAAIGPSIAFWTAYCKRHSTTRFRATSDGL